MASSEQQRNAARVRSDFRKAQIRRVAEAADGLVPPEFAAGDIVDPADNTLNKDVLKVGLAVTIQAWDVPVYDGETDTVSLLWAAEDDLAHEYIIDERSVTAPIPEGTFPMTLTVPSKRMETDGRYRLRYKVISHNGQSTESPPVYLICDGTPPWGDDEPLKMEIADVPITDQYLIDHPEGLLATLPDYPDRQGTDVLFYWWGTLPLPEDPTTIPASGQQPVGATLQVTIPPEVIRQHGDGGCYVVYTIFDKATNRSRLSVYALVGVALGPWPADLKPPVVPLAEDDGLIDLKDAMVGVVVEIPAFSGWKAGDRIEVTWGSTSLGEREIGPAPLFPLQVGIPTQVLRGEYASSDGRLPTPVSYRLLRGTVEIGNSDTSVDVDFSVIGPENPDPDWPDPVNELLLPAQVFGKSSQTLDTLRPEDSGQSAEVEITLYDPLVVGEIIEVYWGAVLVPQATHTVQAEDQPGDVIPLEVPWTYIEQAGNQDQLPVHYRISAPDSTNEQHSPYNLVHVRAIVITPIAPTFLGKNSSDYLTCESLCDPDDPSDLDPAFRVQLPDLSQYLAEGDELILSWKLIAKPQGEEELEDAALVEPITIGPGTPATGFVWRVQPYETHIRPAYNPGAGYRECRGRVTYAFMWQGERVTSEQLEGKVGVYSAGGECDITPKP